MYVTNAYGVLWTNPTFEGLVASIDAYGEAHQLPAVSIVANWVDVNPQT
jgi:hypothetical protein